MCKGVGRHTRGAEVAKGVGVNLVPANLHFDFHITDVVVDGHDVADGHHGVAVWAVDGHHVGSVTSRCCPPLHSMLALNSLHFHYELHSRL